MRLNGAQLPDRGLRRGRFCHPVARAHAGDPERQGRDSGSRYLHDCLRDHELCPQDTPNGKIGRSQPAIVGVYASPVSIATRGPALMVLSWPLTRAAAPDPMQAPPQGDLPRDRHHGCGWLRERRDGDLLGKQALGDRERKRQVGHAQHDHPCSQQWNRPLPGP